MQFKASQEKSGDRKDYDEKAGWKKEGFPMVDEGQDGNKEEEDATPQDGNKEEEDEMATMMALWVLEEKNKTWELERPEELAVPMSNTKFPVKRMGKKLVALSMCTNCILSSD